MSAKTKYTKGPVGEIRVIKDFLPPPSQLIFKEDQEKITITLTARSVDFFRAEAKKHGTQYQRMIRELLDRYAMANSPQVPMKGRRQGRG